MSSRQVQAADGALYSLALDASGNLPLTDASDGGGRLWAVPSLQKVGTDLWARECLLSSLLRWQRT